MMKGCTAMAKQQSEASDPENKSDVAAAAQAASVQSMIELLRDRFPDVEVIHKEDEWAEASVPAKYLLDVANYIRDESRLQMNFLSSISAVDYQEKGFEVVYHLISLPEGRRKLILKVTPEGGRENPWLPSVVSVWPTANWHEREAWDMMGIRFEGHPDLRRILLREDWVGHPLRKDYQDVRPIRERQVKEDWLGRSGT